METKWTPGPWFIVTPTQGFEICTIHGVERQPTEDGLGQTWVYIRPESLVRDGEWTWPDEAECTANAHLISAAPDLYAALEAMIYETTHLSGERDDGSHRCFISKASLTAARSACAKARGEA